MSRPITAFGALLLGACQPGDFPLVVMDTHGVKVDRDRLWDELRGWEG